VNDYARYCVSNKNYKSKWVSYWWNIFYYF
jgi:hypothetical protein